MRRAVWSALLAACLGATLSSCDTTPKEDRPATLTKVVTRVTVRRAWHTHLSGEAPKLREGLTVALEGDRLYAASHSGIVEAFEVSSGRRVWRKQVKAPLSGGPGVGEGLVVVGSAKGDLIALSAADGSERWRQHVNSEILSAPVVARDFVVLRGVDGRLEGHATADGKESWVLDQQVPRLSLRGDSHPILAGDLAVCGFDNGHVVAVVRNTGALAWNTSLDEPHGNSELQRLIDVDAPVVADGDDLFAVAYQGHVARLARETGQVVWRRELSSYRGLAVDANSIYISSADGTVARLERGSGTVQWQQQVLARRELTAPAVSEGRVVVGDLDGYLHWFDEADGAYLARVRAGSSRITAAPIAASDLLIVFTDGGDLSAYRASPTTAPAPTPKPARGRR